MASFTIPCPKTSAICAAPCPTPKQHQLHQQCTVAFKSSPVSSISGSSFRFQGCRHKSSGAFKVSSQLNEVAIMESSNCAPETELEEPAAEDIVPDVSSITAFMSQVQDIIELVDSRDIVELQLKQQGCELIVRKKEALQQQQAAPASMIMMQSPSPHSMMPYQVPPAQASAPAPASAPSPAPAPSPALALPSPQKKKASHPVKCPMAGTFYRSPAPGAPPFVKEGDVVHKGQILCIVEAMKLMNEIEADRSGTIVEILVADGKPVNMGLPLFIIEP